jgi:hypothetical protein
MDDVGVFGVEDVGFRLEVFGLGCGLGLIVVVVVVAAEEAFVEHGR